ncbi:MAG: class I SAM-dependent methyltransferase [Caldilineaceae bacterium]|nr:class I SAM-dependent methyltransferase [Caldilineaceae bacterium]
MNTETRARLLQLNRDFYAAVAAPFHETRKAWSPGKARLLTMLPHVGDRPLRVLDVGCGNGRLARMLDSLARPVIYTGLDGDAALLAFADEHTRDLAHVTCTFVRADLADPAWAQSAGIGRDYDVTLCLATLQHLPGAELRAATVATLARLTTPDGLIILSGWQFLESPRLAAKVLDWSAVDVDPASVEAGDALLPWQQDVYAVRYVHQIDAAEMARLAAHAGLAVTTSFRADGKEGNLNLYVLLRRPEPGQLSGDSTR